MVFQLIKFTKSKHLLVILKLQYNLYYSRKYNQTNSIIGVVVIPTSDNSGICLSNLKFFSITFEFYKSISKYSTVPNSEWKRLRFLSGHWVQCSNSNCLSSQYIWLVFPFCHCHIFFYVAKSEALFHIWDIMNMNYGFWLNIEALLKYVHSQPNALSPHIHFLMVF